MGRPAVQSFIPGTEPPPEDPERTPELDEVVYAWVDARKEKRQASDAEKIRETTMLTKLREAGLERYPFVDPITGKKQYAGGKTTTRGAITKAKGAGRNKRGRAREKDDDSKDENEKAAERAQARLDADDNATESRRVTRESVKDEIDPFANVRGMVEKNEDAS